MLVRFLIVDKIDNASLSVDQRLPRGIETAPCQILHRTTGNEPLKMAQPLQGRKAFDVVWRSGQGSARNPCKNTCRTKLATTNTADRILRMCSQDFTICTSTTKTHEHRQEDKCEQHQDTIKPFTMQELELKEEKRQTREESTLR